MEQDHQKASEYHTKLMDDNLSVGIQRVALIYYNGKGVAVDYLKSSDLFKKVADGHSVNKKPLPHVYDPNNSNEHSFHDDLVYCLMYHLELVGESYYYCGLQHKYGQGVSYDQDKAQYYF